MNRHKLQNYLDQGSLTPTSSQMGEIANSDWWTAVSEQFDDLIWLYYPDRTVFVNDRFPYDVSDPDNADNIDKVIANIKRSFSVYLKANDYKYRTLYATLNFDYNPIYNVDVYEQQDGIQEGTGSVTDSKEGTDTTVKTGSEDLEYLGEESNTRSGSVDTGYAGSESLTKSGNEELTHLGTDTTTVSRTTYDDATFYGAEKTEFQPGASDKNTYNNVKDEKTFTDRKDTTTYNTLADTKAFDERKDTRTYNEVSDATTYGSSNTSTRNLHDSYTKNMRKYGNQGVTTTQAMIREEREVARMEFFKTVVHDCVNLVTYAVS